MFPNADVYHCQSEASARLGPARHSIDVTTPAAGLLTVPGGGPCTDPFTVGSGLTHYIIDAGDTDEEEEDEGSGDEDRELDGEAAKQEMDGLVEQEVG